MNKFSKVVSVALVLILALSVLVIPTSAATSCTAEAKVVAEYQGKTSGGYDYYKFSVYLNSSHTLNAYQLNVSWDNAVWTKLRATTKADFANFNTNVIDRTDVNNIMYNTCEAYELYGMDGENGQWDSEDGSYWGYMPYDGNKPSFAKISDTNLGAELVAAGYTGFYSAWAGDFADEFLCISGGTIKDVGSPVAGEVMVLSWYMRLNDGVAPGNYEVGFNAKQAYQLTAQYCLEDAVTTKECSDQLADIPAANITYSNAIVTVQAEPSPVLAETSQIRYNGPVDGDYAPFDVRTRAYMTAEKFAEICGTDAQAKTAITKVGFVYADSSVGMTLEDAAKVIGGTAVAGCVDVPVEHIQKTADKYIWTCLLEDAVYADAVDAVGYIVVNGETYYFDAVSATDFSELYDTWSSKIPA